MAFVALVVIPAAKLHVLDHVLQLVLERVLEVAVEVALDHVPEVVIIHALVLVQVVVVDALVTVADAPETVDLVVTVVAVEHVMGVA